MTKFNHLNIPDHWEQYWSRYPQGYTILEALISWVSQVDDMVDNVNDWNVYLKEFVEKFDEKLQPTILQALDEMVADGTMATIINEVIFTELNNKIDNTAQELSTLEQTFSDYQETTNNAITDLDNELTADIDNINVWRKHYEIISNQGTPSEVTARLQKALNETDGNSWLVLDGVYEINDTLIGHSANIISRNAELRFSNTGDGLVFRGNKKVINLVAQAGYTQGRNYLLVHSASGVERGDLIRFVSTSELYNPSRAYYYKGTTSVVTDITDDRVYFSHSLPYDIASVNEIELFKPAKVNIEGSLFITNSTGLPNGTTGLKVEYVTDSHIKGVFTDNFVANISIINSTSTTFENCRTLRAYYTGTGTSYGVVVDSSNHIHFENCHSRSGRHGFTTGGFEPVDFITMNNCSWYSEPISGSRSFDTHNNTINIHIKNTEMDSFQVSGNVKMENVTVHHREVTTSMIAQSDSYEKANYYFENVYYPNGGRVDLGAYSQSGGTIDNMNKLGNVTLLNVHGGEEVAQLKLNARGFGGAPKCSILNVKIDNFIHGIFHWGDDIENLTINNMYVTADTTAFFQVNSDSLLKKATIKDSLLPARYVGITINNANRVTFINCSDVGTSNGSPRAKIAGANTHVAFINCDFSSHTEGFQLSVNTYTLIDSVVNMYGTPTGTRKEL